MTDKEILKLVEWIASREMSEDKDLLAIYRAVHSHREDACCHEVHSDWRIEATAAYEDLKKLGEIKD